MVPREASAGFRPRQLRVALAAALSAAVALLLTGCETLGYYRQAVSGQLVLLSQRRPIAQAAQDGDLPATTRRQLQLVQQLREFAARELQLPVEDHYDSYVELGRDFVVWNVFAASPFSLTLQSWCYPVAGCVSYRGYFAEADALRQAQRLQEQGLETYVGGISAYSTLGWFDDPVLSSMLRRDDGQLAGLLFHELAHQRVYAAGDTDFNESFATLVEQEGQQRWLQQQSEPARGELAASVSLQRQRQQQFVALVQQSVSELGALYAEPIPDAERNSRKSELQVRLRQRYAAMKQQWGGYNGYDRWFAGPLNNAQLGTVTTYNRWVPALQALLDRCNGELARFYAEAELLARLSADERRQRLQQLAPAA